VQNTRNIDRTTRTAREMAEVQRDSYEALAENLAAAQRRAIGLDEGGFEFMRLQEEKVTREAELRATVFGALKTSDYDGLSVDDVSKRLEGLSTEELQKVREYEKQNKNRETLIDRIDSKRRANS
jgi:hypothetical protein